MKAQRLFLLAALMVALTLHLGIPTQSARADTIFMVNSGANHDDGVCDSDCTLREAVSLAQAGSGGGTVKFDPSVFPAESALTVWELAVLHSSVTIDGAVTGGTVELIVPPFNWLFTVAPGATLNLQNIEMSETVFISGDLAGAAITNRGTVNVTNSRFFHLFAENGGAIFNEHGWLNVTNSTFQWNMVGYADGGGAIYNKGGTATITNSWFVGNGANRGGAIYNNAGTLTLANSIVASNFSDDGAIYNTGTATLINDTIAFNRNFFWNPHLGGGIYNASTGSLTLKNSIVAQNTTYNCSGSGIIDGGYNLDDGSTCGFSPANRSQPGVDPLFVRSYVDLTDPNGLLPLQLGSPAIDAADDSVCAADPVNNLDQRGFTRPRGPHCDIGALEAQRATLVVVNHVVNDNSGTSSASDFTMTVEGSYPSLTSFAGAEAPGIVVGLAPGAYSVTQSGPAGYTSSATNCSGTIADNQTITCTFTNDDLGYTFSGFFSPVDNLPTLNVVQAGESIPIKFGLGGYQGLDVLAPFSPTSQLLTCDGGELGGSIEETVSTQGLSYDAATDTYTYVWKTNAAWAGTCRQLSVRLRDDTNHVANFQFRP